MPLYDVLIVEDDPALREALCDTLEIEGYRVVTACNGTDALSQLAKHRFQLVVSDVQMPVMDGLQLMHNMQQQYATTPILLMTAYGTVPKAVAAMQSGAIDYLIKPFSADVLVQKVATLTATRPMTSNDQVVQDPVMQDLYALIKKVAKTDVTVLLQGESGTGKEVVARFIHRHSLYSQGPFIALNCAAIPEQMLEAMLFGYEKGAFTGAVQSAPGKFEMAQGGTLLLDEVSEMALGLQAKLLRVLQEKEVERLGSHQKISLHVRILATTNRMLKAQVAQGHFREDLYYRLCVFPFTIPPLRERIGDILPLAQDLLLRHCAVNRPLVKIPTLAPPAIKKLLAYRWPGNVRELENVIQRALIICENASITVDDLLFDTDTMPVTRQEVPALTNADKLDDGVRFAEEHIILHTLHEQNGSRKMTALKLGVSDRTLRYKIARMKEAGIVIPC
ncbi:MAG: sigma-54 dependent transcriptional regulator [Methylococcaceae bacterium]